MCSSWARLHARVAACTPCVQRAAIVDSASLSPCGSVVLVFASSSRQPWVRGGAGRRRHGGVWRLQAPVEGCSRHWQPWSLLPGPHGAMRRRRWRHPMRAARALRLLSALPLRSAESTGCRATSCRAAGGATLCSRRRSAANARPAAAPSRCPAGRVRTKTVKKASRCVPGGGGQRRAAQMQLDSCADGRAPACARPLMLAAPACIH